MPHVPRLVGAMVITVVLGSCAPWQGASTVAPTPTHHAHWSYEGDTGPAHWGDLDPEYALCAQGTAQTPIDIAPTENQAVANPIVRYQVGDVTVVNNGHTVQANAAPGNSIVVDSTEYSLAQMHFHAPSEHTIDGTPARAEVHFVHKSADGSLTVIGALIQAGDDNPAWTPYVEALDTAVDASTTTTLDWAALLPNDLVTYRYRGSLTTPPCSEGVNWMVLQTPITLSEAQIAAFTAAYDGNARPIQADNDRTVIVDSSDS